MRLAKDGWRERQRLRRHTRAAHIKNKNKIKYVKRRRITDGLLHVQTSVPI